MIELLSRFIDKYPKTFLTTATGFGTVGIYNGWRVTKFDNDGNPELYIDRITASIFNGIAYATPFMWPLTTFCLIRRAEVHMRKIDKSDYDWLYSEYLGLGRLNKYSKQLAEEEKQKQNKK